MSCEKCQREQEQNGKSFFDDKMIRVKIHRDI